MTQRSSYPGQKEYVRSYILENVWLQQEQRMGFFTLSIEGASIVHRLLPGKKLRVVISEEAAPFVEKGKTAFIKHVVEIDPELRAGEEVLVTDETDKLLATGQLLLSPAEILVLNSGAAVDVRAGVASKKRKVNQET